MPHTAADNKESVFLNDMPEYSKAYEFEGLAQKWDKQFMFRDDVMKALEVARASKLIGKPLDAKVTVYTEDKEAYELLSSFAGELATIYIVSGASVVLGKAPEGTFAETETGIAVLVEKADGEKCDRCWAYSTEGEKSDDGFICARCKSIIEG